MNAPDADRMGAVAVLAEHRLRYKRPAMPGPGEAWTCSCGVFGVSGHAQSAHDQHVATHLEDVARSRLEQMAEGSSEAEIRWLIGEWLVEIGPIAPEVSDDLRAAIPTDTTEALARVRAEAKAEALREVADEATAPSITGQSAGNPVWPIEVAHWLRRRAAAHEAGTGGES